jgi:bacterioferritin
VETASDDEAQPSLERLGKVSVGQTVEAQLRLDLSARRRRSRVPLSPRVRHSPMPAMRAVAATHSSSHIGWIEEPMELIRQVGEAHYLAQQIKEGDA